MISNDTELLGALQQITWAADALEGIRRGTNRENIVVFPTLAESYLVHIRTNIAEAQAYAERPTNETAEPDSTRHFRTAKKPGHAIRVE